MTSSRDVTAHTPEELVQTQGETARHTPTPYVSVEPNDIAALSWALGRISGGWPTDDVAKASAIFALECLIERAEFAPSLSHAYLISQRDELREALNGVVDAYDSDSEFDATKEESDEWARSPDGQAAAKELSPAMREVLGLKLLS